ncbi:MAG: hypothetical protein LBK05_05545 [Treponema sp.]|jgi:hypothetical protein|nr:hypothetical protein [Treponema sp.]
MVFGIKLGAKAVSKNETLFGREAVERYNAVKDRLPAAALYFDGGYEGGAAKIAPAFETERCYYDRRTMPCGWKGITRIVSYYDNGPNGATTVKR